MDFENDQTRARRLIGELLPQLVAMTEPEGLDLEGDVDAIADQYHMKTIEIEDEDEEGNRVTTQFYVAEGDLLLDSDEVLLHDLQKKLLKRRSAVEDAFTSAGMEPMEPRLPTGLVSATHGRRIIRWKDGMTIKYCVLRRTFPDDDSYNLVVDCMQKATADWENTCGVKFGYSRTKDTSLTLMPTGVTFPVRFIDAQGAFIAASFFPNTPLLRRRLLIDPTFLHTRFNKVGVLRHELGHILGFRHEHIRSGAPAICPDESMEDTLELTDYDPQSVMHYFCGQLGSIELALTELDRLGAQKVYGLPLARYSFYK